MRSNDASASANVELGQSRLKPAVTGVSLFLLLLSRLGACIWDSDTAREEAYARAGKERLSLLGSLTGRIDRMPPRYYKMRLHRVIDTMDTSSGVDALEMCDDAGVACERRGYVEGRLALGEHPDTHSTFWENYKSSTSPPVFVSKEANMENYITSFLTVGVLLVTALIVAILARRRLQSI